MFSLRNNAIHCMNFSVHIVGTYRAMSNLGGVNAAIFNYHQFNEMTGMSDEIVLARIMTALGLEFEKVLHYHDEAYESDNDYGQPVQVMRHVHIYSISTTEASFNPANYKGAQCLISPFMPR